MLGPQGDPAFVARIRGLSEAAPQPAAGAAAGLPAAGVCLSFLAHAGIGALAWWLETEPPPRPPRSRPGSTGSTGRPSTPCWRRLRQLGPAELAANGGAAAR